MRIHENHAALLRARIVHQALPCADRATALEELRRAVIGRAHVDETALLDAVLLEPCVGARAARDNGSPGPCSRLRRDPPSPARAFANEGCPGRDEFFGVVHWQARQDVTREG